MAASSETKKKPRGKGRPFQPGQSGNPAGLSAQRRRILTDLQRDEQEHIRSAVARLREIALDRAAPIDDVRWAMEQYLNRMGIVMPEKLELTGEDGAELGGGDAALTTEDLRQRLAEVQALREKFMRKPGEAPAVHGAES
jgi:hypothetical protein